jgi:hypothetical protein
MLLLLHTTQSDKTATVPNTLQPAGSTSQQPKHFASG